VARLSVIVFVVREVEVVNTNKLTAISGSVLKLPASDYLQIHASPSRASSIRGRSSSRNAVHCLRTSRSRSSPESFSRGSLVSKVRLKRDVHLCVVSGSGTNVDGFFRARLITYGGHTSSLAKNGSRKRSLKSTAPLL